MAPKGKSNNILMRPAAALCMAAACLSAGSSGIAGTPGSATVPYEQGKKKRGNTVARSEASKELEEAVQELQRKWKGKAPDFTAIKQHFKEKQLPSLRMKLTRARKGTGDMSLVEAWHEICSMKVGSCLKKQNVLVKYLQDPDGDAWKEHLLEVSEELQRRVQKHHKKQEFTKGEICQIHGEDEALDSIKKGIFVPTKHSTYGTVYIMSTRSWQETESYAQTVRVSKWLSFFENENQFSLKHKKHFTKNNRKF